MSKSTKPKTWRMNVVVDYFNSQNVKTNRYYILELLKNLASIYKLDYAISKNHLFPPVADYPEFSPEQIHADIIYFRSNNYTRFDRKEFRTIIDTLFNKIPTEFEDGYEVFPQLYKNLNDFPFPSEFFRPLNYPWIEYYKGAEKKVMIISDVLMEVIDNEQNHLLN